MKKNGLDNYIKFGKFIIALVAFILVAYNMIRNKMEAKLSANFNLHMNYLLSFFLILLGIEQYSRKNNTLGYFLVFCGLFVIIVNILS
ncbi:MAG: DUF3953 domain-containing protein [Firmicutes bacterium]|jgi:signal transduction histidine kinase|nr:DUF3953 domain-containing protein [Bacillota bacterium]